MLHLSKSVNSNQKALKCTNCELWVHIKCNGTSNKEYDDMLELNKFLSVEEIDNIFNGTVYKVYYYRDRAEIFPVLNKLPSINTQPTISNASLQPADIDENLLIW